MRSPRSAAATTSSSPAAGSAFRARRHPHRALAGSRVIIAIAATFLTVFVVLPLVVVFAQAFSKGIGAYFSALADPEALPRFG